MQILFDDYLIQNDLLHTSTTNHQIIIKPNDELSEALDYEDFVDAVLEGNVLVYNGLVPTQVKDYTLTNYMINYLLLDKCESVYHVLELIQNAKNAILVFLNGKDTNAYLMMEILDRHEYSHNFTEYELYSLIIRKH